MEAITNTNGTSVLKYLTRKASSNHLRSKFSHYSSAKQQFQQDQILHGHNNCIENIQRACHDRATDADIMWFRDPLPHFYPDGDFQISCDRYSGSATDLRNRPNGGFNYVKSNNRSIEFYKFWYSSREKHPGLHDQDVLNFIKYDPFLAEIGVRIRFLSTTYFGGICEPSRDFSKVCTMHANCCIGLGRKIHDLRVMLDDWRNYMALPPNKKRSGLYSWRVPQNCSLAELHS